MCQTRALASPVTMETVRIRLLNMRNPRPSRQQRFLMLPRTRKSYHQRVVLVHPPRVSWTVATLQTPIWNDSSNWIKYLTSQSITGVYLFGGNAWISRIQAKLICGRRFDIHAVLDQFFQCSRVGAIKAICQRQMQRLHMWFQWYRWSVETKWKFHFISIWIIRMRLCCYLQRLLLGMQRVFDVTPPHHGKHATSASNCSYVSLITVNCTKMIQIFIYFMMYQVWRNCKHENRISKLSTAVANKILTGRWHLLHILQCDAFQEIGIILSHEKSHEIVIGEQFNIQRSIQIWIGAIDDSFQSVGQFGFAIIRRLHVFNWISVNNNSFKLNTKQSIQCVAVELTLKKDTKVICGKQLCAPFQPHFAFDSDQNASRLSLKWPVGHAYSTYSRGSFSSSLVSFTWLISQSHAKCKLLLPTAANAFSL